MEEKEAEGGDRGIKKPAEIDLEEATTSKEEYNCEKCGAEIEYGYVSENWRDEFCTEEDREKSIWPICEACIDTEDLRGLIYHQVRFQRAEVNE